MECQIDFWTLEAGTQSCSPGVPKRSEPWLEPRNACGAKGAPRAIARTRKRRRDEEGQLGLTEQFHVPGSVLSTLHMWKKFNAFNATCTTRSYHSTTIIIPI